MPPRARRVPLDAARDAALAQWSLVAAAVAALPDDTYSRTTRLGDWTVADLVAHLGVVASGIAPTLAATVAPGPVMSLPDYLGLGAAAADDIARVTREHAGPPPELRERVDSGVRAATAALAAEPADRPVAVRGGALALSDFLVSRCVEGVVHGLDLAATAATGGTVDLAPAALRLVVRGLADVLAASAPGRSVEVRIPGPAGTAVQCVPGPRHTRGTPPNVVETDATTWVELATGRVTWAAAVAAGRVSASGERADLSAYLPVLS